MTKAKEEAVSLDDYLCVEALGGVIFGIEKDPFYDYDIEYMVNGDGNWINIESDNYNYKLAKGDKAYFRGVLREIPNGLGIFYFDNSVAIGGNVMSMVYGDDAKGKTSLEGYPSIFLRMFSGCTTIKSVSQGLLPATELSEGCYQEMFYGCSNMEGVPDLPATALQPSCYLKMFRGCKKITSSPDLPSATLVSKCYEQMFYGCSVLKSIKAMFLTTPGTSYTNNWVYSVASGGAFHKNKDATWNVSGNSGVPSNWTVYKV